MIVTCLPPFLEKMMQITNTECPGQSKRHLARRGVEIVPMYLVGFLAI